MLTITLFTKAGRGLCDEVKRTLATFQTIYPHLLKEVDITQNDALFKNYRYTIPVVRIGKQELAAPITAVQLQNALKETN